MFEFFSRKIVFDRLELNFYPLHRFLNAKFIGSKNSLNVYSDRIHLTSYIHRATTKRTIHQMVNRPRVNKIKHTVYVHDDVCNHANTPTQSNVFFLLLLLLTTNTSSEENQKIERWMTTRERERLFKPFKHATFNSMGFICLIIVVCFLLFLNWIFSVPESRLDNQNHVQH